MGGNSADEALYNPSLHIAVDRTSKQSQPQSQSQDDPATIGIGQSFFESYSTWPDIRFIHGFNLALSTKSSADWESLLATVPLACTALGDGKLLWWEYGNEPDLYTSTTSAKGQVRATSWGNSAYVSQWLNGTQSIKSTLAQACPNMVGNNTYGYIAPSFASPDNGVLGATATWQDGLDMDEDIKLISIHKYASHALALRNFLTYSSYIASTTAPGVSLQGTLLNHTETVKSIAQQLNGYRFLPNASIPIVLSETNSLLNTGTPGISNTFGAALWNIDYGLWCASQNISRIHMQQGTNFYYNAWQPINTDNVTIGTKPPYYGNIFVAAMLANSTSSEVKVSNIPLNTSTEAAYGAYVNGVLKRIAILNMQGYDYTMLSSKQLDPRPRGQQNYTFSVPQSSSTVASVKRLSANGSDALSGITFDGYSYEYELKEGMPVLLPNVTRGETVNACNGLFTVQLMDSSAVMMEFM